MIRSVTNGRPKLFRLLTLVFGSLSSAAAMALAKDNIEVQQQDVRSPVTTAQQAKVVVVQHPDVSHSDVMKGFPPPKDKRVTVDNYRAEHASTRWAHLHMRELFPTQAIGRGDRPIRMLPVRSVVLDEIRIPHESGNAVTISEWLRQSQTDAFLILHNGAIVREEYFCGMNEYTPHHLWSASKSISAGVVANLIALGKLNEQRPITEYVPELKGTGYDGAILRDLLDMQSGVAWDYESPGETSTWPRWERASGLARRLPSEPMNESLYDFMLKADDIRRQARSHGATFYYKESDPQALAWACEKVTGTRFSDLLSEHVWSRIGAERDAYIVCDSLGTSLPWGGISVTLRDFGRWGQAYLDERPERHVVPRPFIEDIRRSWNRTAITDESFPGPRHGLPANAAYRSLHWIYRYQGENVLIAAGNYGQFCAIFPKRKLVFVKLSTYNMPSQTNDISDAIKKLLHLDEQARSAFCAIADALGGKAE